MEDPKIALIRDVPRAATVRAVTGSARGSAVAHVEIDRRLAELDRNGG